MKSKKKTSSVHNKNVSQAAKIIARFLLRPIGDSNVLKSYLSHRKLFQALPALANKVYGELSWGWREDVYREALAYELRLQGHLVEAEVTSPVIYQSRPLQYVNFRIDLLVDKTVILELKACAGDGRTMIKAHQQCLRYLKMKNYALGMVINFPEKSDQQVCQQMVVNN